jgi:hypothetical protein
VPTISRFLGFDLIREHFQATVLPAAYHVANGKKTIILTRQNYVVRSFTEYGAMLLPKVTWTLQLGCMYEEYILFCWLVIGF